MKAKRHRDPNRAFMYGILILSFLVIAMVMLFTQWALQAHPQATQAL